MKFLFVFPILIIALLGQEQSMEFDESFNPDSLKEPPLEWPVILYPGDKIPEKGTSTQVDSTEEGYRVQVISTQDFEVANSLKGEMVPLFKGEVYVTFDPPNYKVRVGNFLFRAEAEKAQLKLRRLGYRTAWIIRTQIKAHPRPE